MHIKHLITNCCNVKGCCLIVLVVADADIDTAASATILRKLNMFLPSADSDKPGPTQTNIVSLQVRSEYPEIELSILFVFSLTVDSRQLKTCCKVVINDD